MRTHNLRLLAVWTGLALVGQPGAHGIWTAGSARPASTPANTPANTPAKTPATPTVDFELYRDYLIVVQASAGPLKGLNFLLDTGATPSVLSPGLAQQLHLNATPTAIPVLGGSVPGAAATLPSLQLGPVRKENLRVLIEDLSFIGKWLPFRIDGIVGLDLLGQSAFVIDYPSREISFGPPPPMPASMSTSVPLQITQGLPIVTAIVNRASVRLLLDTGAPSLILFEQPPTPAPSPLTGAAPHPSGSIGSFDRKLTRQISLQLGEAEFGNEPAYIVHSPRDAGHNFDGLIGPAALGIARLAFDPDRGTLAFSRAP
ncbi:MAG: retroviral-like aspartic protease family protein [Acidobacteriaceae bacterium]